MRGASTFTGNVAVAAGSLKLSGGDNRLPTTATVTLGSGTSNGILTLGNTTGASNQTISGLFVSGTGVASAVQGGNNSISTLTVTGAHTGTYSGLLGVGNGNTTVTPANELALALTGGSLSLTGNNTYLGNTTITGGGVLQIFADNNLGFNDSTSATGVSIGTGSTLEISNPNTLNPTYSLTSNRAITLSGTNAGLEVDTGGTVTLGANSKLGGTGDFVLSGNGLLVLGTNASNITYTGATKINGGTLQLTQMDTFTNGFSSTTNVTVASGALLDLNSFDQSIGSLAGAGNVTAETANLFIGGGASGQVFSGNISGTGSLTFSGVSIFNGTNSFHGTTNINSGNLTINSSLALSNSSINVGLDNGLLFGSAAGTSTIGSLQGSGNLSLTKVGGGAVALTIGNDGSFGDNYTGSITGGAGAVLTKIGAGSQTLGGLLTGFTGGLAVNGGTLTLSGGASNYTGGSTIGTGGKPLVVR